MTDISNYCIPDLGTHRVYESYAFLHNRAIAAAAAGGEKAFLADRVGLVTDEKALLCLEEIFSSLPNYKRIHIQAKSHSAMVLAIWGDASENSFSYNLQFHLGRIDATVMTCNTEILRKFHEWGNQYLIKSPTSNRGRVEILVQEKDRITTASLGYASVPLSLENYSKGIHGDIIQAVEELNNPFPPGRLFVLDGPPGGGKTFLIRSLISEVPHASFVFVPPPLIPSLGDPHLVSALIQMKEDSVSVGRRDEGGENEFSSIVLVCEDADSILVKRQMDNMPSISSLLNITSGFLSDLLDIRVLATTNAPVADIDPALTRSGRLSGLIHVGPLTPEEATQSLSKIVDSDVGEEEVDWQLSRGDSISTRTRTGFGNSSDEASGVLLSTVYEEARRRGWTPLGTKASQFMGVAVVEVPDYIKELYPEGSSFDGNGILDIQESEFSKTLSRMRGNHIEG